MVDSAPELRLIVPSPARPSYVRPVDASYIGWPARFAPKYHAATNAATCFRPGRPTASRPWSRASTPYAICVRSIGVGSQPLSGPPAVIKSGVKPAVSPIAGPISWDTLSAFDAAARPEGIWAPQACQSEIDSPQGMSARNGHSRVDPAAIRAMPAANWLSARRARGEPPARTYAARPSAASLVASAPLTISQAGSSRPSTTL